jgi:hypothetical protein
MRVSPHHPPRGGEGLGEELGIERTTCVLERCGVVLGPCGGGPMVRSNVSLMAGYWRLGAWVVGRRRCTVRPGRAAGE